jgi:hypothetical protein
MMPLVDMMKFIRAQLVFFAITQIVLAAMFAGRGMWLLAFVVGVPAAFTVYSVILAHRLVWGLENTEPD